MQASQRIRSSQGLGWVCLLVGTLALGVMGGSSAAAETITWTNLAGGSWNTATNWNPNDVPNEAGEEALVPSGSTYTITLNTSPTLDAVSVNNTATTLNLGGNALSLLLPRGLTNTGIIVANSGTSTINGSISNEALARIFTMNNTNLAITGPTFTNNGGVTINSNSGTSTSQLQCNASISLEGSGTLYLQTAGQTNDAEIRTAAGYTLTQAATHTIAGSGGILADFINYGTVRADVPTLVLLLDAKPETNHGTMRALGGGILEVGAMTLTQGAAGRLEGDAGTVRLLNSSTVSGGTLTSSNGGKVTTVSGAATLRDVTNEGVLEIAPGTLNLAGTLLTDDGTITLNPAGLTTNAIVAFTENVTLDGSGTCVMNAVSATNDAIIQSAAGMTGTHGAGHTIRGSGEISAQLDNEGLISAEVASIPLVLITNPKTNSGTLRATSGGTLQISGCTVTQDPGGTILADNGTVSPMSGATLVGGTLATANGGTFLVPAATVTLRDLTNQGQFGIKDFCTTQLDGSFLTNDGTITVNSNVGTGNAFLKAVANVALQGSGAVVLLTAGNTNDAEITAADGVTLTQAASHTIRGSGQIHAPLVNEGLISADQAGKTLELTTSPKTNRGELRAENGGRMQVQSIAVTQEDAGRIMADNGVVVLSDAWVIGGPLMTANGGSVRCELGSAHLQDVANLGTFEVAGNYNVYVHGSTQVNDGVFHLNYDGSTLNSQLRFEEDATLTGAGEVRLNARTSVNDAVLATLGEARLLVLDDQTIRGSGQLAARMENHGTILADSPPITLDCMGDTLENHGVMRAENGATLRAYSGVLYNGSQLVAVDSSQIAAFPGELINRGNVLVSEESSLNLGSGGLLTNESMIYIGAAGHLGQTEGILRNTIHGTVRVEAGGAALIDYGEYYNVGLTEVQAGGSYWSDRVAASGQFSGTTFTGGTWQVADGGTMRLIGVNVQTLDAGVVLIGANAMIYSDNGTTNALANLQRITRGGHLDVRNGRNFATPGALAVNLGGLTVGAGCAFTVNGQFTQTGNGEFEMGRTCVNGTLTSTAATLDIQGGALEGSGTITNNVQSNGWVRPGTSAGTLTITGNYAQAEAGTFYVELGGTAPGQSDRLQVNGQATLAGRLVVMSIPGYVPQIGDHFTILNCGSRSGEFTVETGSPGIGLVYQTDYYADRVEIEILGDPSYVPEPELTDDDTTPPSGDPSTQPTVPGNEPSTNDPSAMPTAIRLQARASGIGAVMLELALPEAAQVELRLFDFNGRFVANLQQGLETAGTHTYRWTGSESGARLASGIYFASARISTGERVTVRQARVLLVR